MCKSALNAAPVDLQAPKQAQITMRDTFETVFGHESDNTSWPWVRQHELAMSQTTRGGHESDNTRWPWVRQHELAMSQTTRGGHESDNTRWPWVRQHEVAMSQTTRGGHESDNTSGRQLAAGCTRHRTVPPLSKVPPLATTSWRVSRSLCLYAASYKRLKLYN